MIPYLEVNSHCISCDNCKLICPENSILSNGIDYIIDTWTCTLCSACIEVCPVNAIKLITTPPPPKKKKN